MKNKGIGAKTRALMRLQKAGFRVPNLIAFSNKDIKDNDFIALAQKARKALKVRKYAVRSSALIEDGKTSSYAGQFMTKVNQDYDDLPAAIEEVVHHGQYFLNGHLDKFSIIVQEYIDADFAGVLFTRNPMGGREMVLESFKGIGEQVVGGEVRPDQLKFYWNGQVPKALPFAEELVKNAKKIEKLFDFPQDIEWCVKKKKVYFLQSRAITTIEEKSFEEMKYLEEVLPRKDAFCFEKSEISEIAARPCDLTLSLLKKIYKDKGPVSKVYKKYKVEYKWEDFLKVLGNELYVDRKKEAKTLMDGWWMSTKNAWNLSRMSFENYDLLRAQIEAKIHAKFDKEKNFEERLEMFLDDYQIIFELNLLASKAVKNLSRLMRGQAVSAAEILACNFETEYEDFIHFTQKGLKGNSLDIADESAFVIQNQDGQISENVDKWYDSLNDLKKRMYVPVCLEAQKLNRLRENGRWLTVKYINYLRESLPKRANIYFASAQELIKNKLDSKVLTKRKKEFDAFSDFSLPVKISSDIIVDDKMLKGVSAGQAEGVLMDEDNIKKGGILYVKILGPDLTKHFKKVAGIVSQQGGMLSHLAIMAREAGIPVVVGLNLEKSAFQLGDMVELDGAKGEILLKTELSQDE